MTLRRGCALALIVALPALGSVGCGSGRDAVPVSKDVRGVGGVGTDGPKPVDGYEYVARRKLGTVALAEARGLPQEVAGRAIDALADRLQACAAELEKSGKLVRGATRVVAAIEPNGTVNGLNVKVSQGRDAAANAILCVISPLRALTFPAADGDAGARGIAIEAAWEGTGGTGGTGVSGGTGGAQPAETK
jgi:hypothetical protein